MAIEWKQNRHCEWYISHRGLTFHVHRPLIQSITMKTEDVWLLTSRKIGFQLYALSSSDIADAKQEALTLVMGKIASLSEIIDEIRAALEGD
jgi:hypothetical protein